MKSFFIAIIAIIVTALPCRAQRPEEIVPAGYIYEEKADTSDNGFKYNAILIGGVGYSSNVLGYYSYAPTLTLGFEIPFSKTHMSSFQLYSHIWIDDNLNLDKYCCQYNNHYEAFVSLGNGYYSMFGLAGVFKFYILDKNSDFRFSLHFGALFLTPRYDYPGFDFGFTGYYRINESIMLSLERRYNFMPPEVMAGGGGPANFTCPIITTFNMYYFFRW
jgi:hypothetical protein